MIIMNTRSQTKKHTEPSFVQQKSHEKIKEREKEKEKENIILTIELDVNIDFDYASGCWKANKKSIGNGSYKYICSQKTKTGNQCKRESLQGCDYCKIHSNNLK